MNRVYRVTLHFKREKHAKQHLIIQLFVFNHDKPKDAVGTAKHAYSHHGEIERTEVMVVDDDYITTAYYFGSKR